MDIQYLLFLQGLRLSTGGIFDEFFNAISKIAVDIMPFVPFIIFWCADKKWGYRLLATLGIGEVVNGLIKLTVCAYRPWIRSELIHPAGDSKVAATGYSFPSGHTMCATTMYGSLFVWQREKRKWFAIFCCVMIALTGFSRNFLGVHTPQDVLVGLVESIILIAIIGVVQKKVDGDEKKLDILSILGIIAVTGTLIYITQKSYPMDYVNGKLLVDPVKMQKDCFSACGMALGLILGSYIERHFIHYEIPYGAKNLPLLTAAGFMIALAWKEFLAKAIVVFAFGNLWGNLLKSFVLWIFVIAVWPLFIRKWAE